MGESLKEPPNPAFPHKLIEDPWIFYFEYLIISVCLENLIHFRCGQCASGVIPSQGLIANRGVHV